MSKDLNKKLLAEALVAVENNDIAKATRLFQRHWNLAAKNSFALLESEDEDFEISDLGDDFNQEIADEAGSDKEQKFEQLLIAVDELEDKLPTEKSEETQAKFDDLRNKIDEMKLADDEEIDTEDCTVIIEDLKADFEVADAMDDEVSALFDELESGLCGSSSEDEVDVADEDDIEVDEIEDDEEDLEESAEESVDVDFKEEDEQGGEEDIDAELDFEDDSEEDLEDDEESDDLEGEDESNDLDIIYDAKQDAEELLAKLEELEAAEKSEEGEPVEECWTNVKLPRNKLQNEEEGVKKQGMKFGKPGSLKTTNGMGVAKTSTAGKSADQKVKVNSTENKGAKSWHKVEKPANTAAKAKSPLAKV